MVNSLYEPCTPTGGLGTHGSEKLLGRRLLEIWVDVKGARPNGSSHQDVASEVGQSTKRISDKVLWGYGSANLLERPKWKSQHD